MRKSILVIAFLSFFICGCADKEWEQWSSGSQRYISRVWAIEARIGANPYGQLRKKINNALRKNDHQAVKSILDEAMLASSVVIEELTELSPTDEFRIFHGKKIVFCEYWKMFLEETLFGSGDIFGKDKKGKAAAYYREAITAQQQALEELIAILKRHRAPRKAIYGLKVLLWSLANQSGIESNAPGEKFNTLLSMASFFALPVIFFFYCLGGPLRLISDETAGLGRKISFGIFLILLLFYLYRIVEDPLFVYMLLTVAGFYIWLFIEHRYGRLWKKPSSTDTWICRKCGEENHKITTACNKCGGQGRSKHADLPAESAWACSNCEAENSINDKSCSRCGHRREGA